MIPVRSAVFNEQSAISLDASSFRRTQFDHPGFRNYFPGFSLEGLTRSGVLRRPLAEYFIYSIFPRRILNFGSFTLAFTGFRFSKERSAA